MRSRPMAAAGAGLDAWHDDRCPFSRNQGASDNVNVGGTAKTCLPASRFAGFDEICKTMSETSSLRSFNVPDYLPHATRCVTYMPFRQDARRLKQSESKTVLLVEAIDVDAQSRPIVFHEMLCAGICRRLVFGDMRPVASSKAPSIQLRLANRIH